MADPPRYGQQRGNLDASGPRDVVFCHQCDNEWYHDDHGLECPRCGGEITEIITPESDPRPIQAPLTPPDFHSLRNHNPWPDSDPEEADIEEHITRGPGGSVFISQTIRSSGPRIGRGNRRGGDLHGQPEPNEVMRDFQQMLGTLMGPGIRQGQAGRSGPDDLFPPPGPFGGGFTLGGNGVGGGPGPAVVGGRFTYTTGTLRPRNADAAQNDGPPVDDLATYASPSRTHPFPRGRSLLVVSVTAPPDQLASLIGNIFGQMGAPGEGRQAGPPGMPMDLPGLFASLLNPANARHGDAVYSQEALDQIISTLMEQHPTSNAPGPASPDAIASLPKKKLDEKLLGPEGKGECSVCMDDVKIGDEVVHLPCSHWFHETCASMWLSEHNTCPICRKGIEGETPASETRRPSQSGPTAPTTRNEHRARRMSQSRISAQPQESTRTPGRNEARLTAIRNAAGLSSDETQQSRRWQVPEERSGNDNEDYTRRMPGSYRRRDSELSVENQRDSRRGNTSGSDLSRDSRRSSHSGNGGGSGNGAMAWLRDRFSRHD